jgi:hypothetical protein
VVRSRRESLRTRSVSRRCSDEPRRSRSPASRLHHRFLGRATYLGIVAEPAEQKGKLGGCHPAAAAARRVAALMDRTQGVIPLLSAAERYAVNRRAMPRASARVVLVRMHEPALRPSSAHHASQKHRPFFTAYGVIVSVQVAGDPGPHVKASLGLRNQQALGKGDASYGCSAGAGILGKLPGSLLKSRK